MSTLVPQQQVVLGPMTTLHIGGAAEYFVRVESVDQLRDALTWAHENAKPVTVLGHGSNVLIPDEGIEGLVIQNAIGNISVVDEKEDQVLVVAGAGVVFDELVEYTVGRDLWGLENLSAIPGSVGATPVQNVGAYGVEIADVLAWVEVLDKETLELSILSPEDCAFAYRHSLFKSGAGKRYIITRVACTLLRSGKPQITYRDLRERFKDVTTPPSLAEIRAAVIAIRARKFPDWTKIGTAGSFFKNPIIEQEVYEKLCKQYPGLPGYVLPGGHVKITLGFVLDRVCGLRGAREGNVGTYEGQALVLINYGGASAIEVERFAKKIREVVFDATGINIEWEVTYMQNVQRKE